MKLVLSDHVWALKSGILKQLYSRDSPNWMWIEPSGTTQIRACAWIETFGYNLYIVGPLQYNTGKSIQVAGVDLERGGSFHC